MKTTWIAGILCLVSAGAFAQADLTPGNDGTASYGYTFSLPAARGRYQPALALSYNSGAPASVYGVGWTLNLSYIEKASRASLDTTGSPRNTWWLTLNGSARVLAADPMNTGYFRPDVDSGYTELHQNSDSSWTMVDGAGNTYSFQLPSGNPSHRYYLTKVVDVDGNTTQFTYVMEASSDTASSSAVLASISYNNYPLSPSSFANTIQLHYSTNPNPQTEVIDGSLVEHSLLLSSVVVERIGFELKSYTLSYKQSGQTGRQLLTQVQQYGTVDPADGGAPIDEGFAFSYSAENDGGTNSSWLSRGAPDAGSFPTNPLSSVDCLVLFGGGPCKVTDIAAYEDINGDGLPDMVWTTISGADAGLWWAKNVSTPGNVSFGTPTPIPPGTQPLGGQDPVWPGSVTLWTPSASQPTESLTTRQTLFMDLNGDGLPDLVESDSPNCPGQSNIEVRYNQGESGGNVSFSGYLCTDLCAGTTPGPACSVMNMWMAATGSTETDAGVSSSPIGLGYESVVEIADMNGDGIPDYLISVPGPAWLMFPGYVDGVGRWQLVQDFQYLTIPSTAIGGGGTAAVPFQTPGSSGTVNQDLADMNADGFPDLVTNQASGGGLNWEIQYLAPGNYFPAAFEVPPGSGSPDWTLTATCAPPENCPIQEGTFSGTFFWPVEYKAKNGTLVDVNGDGKPDYLYTDLSGELRYLPNIGTGFDASADLGHTGVPFGSSYAGTTCASGTCNLANIDLDGDGLIDYLAIPFDGVPTVRLGVTSDSTPAADLLTKIRTPLMATISLGYASSVAFAAVPFFRPHPVVTTIQNVYPIADTGSNYLVHNTYRYYGTPIVLAAWDDPHRIDQLGFGETWSLDHETDIATHDLWGTLHVTQGSSIFHEVGANAVYGSGPSSPPTFTSFDQTTQDYESCENLGTSQYPTLVELVASDHKLIESGTTIESQWYGPLASGTSSTTGNGIVVGGATKHATCSSIDTAGNNGQVTVVRDVTDPQGGYTVNSTFASATSSLVSCKNCVLESYANSPSWTGDLFRRRYHYDAPVGSFGPAPNNATSGHLNYVEDLVSGSGDSGVFEVSSSVSYKADGVVSAKQQLFAGQPVSAVITAYVYDSLDLRVSYSELDDGISGYLLETSYGYDPNTASLLSVAGPFVDGTAAQPISNFQYDSYLRQSGSTRQDHVGDSPYQLTLQSYTYATPGNLAFAYSASFVSKVSATTTVPSTDDAISSYTYFDGNGRPLQTRTRRGSGSSSSPASSAHIVQGLSSGYLVQAAIYDAAGRNTWVIDPYYAASGVFEDLTASSAPALAATSSYQPHGTYRAYDSKLRPTCSMYQPISGSLTPASSSCVSSGAIRAAASTYNVSTEFSRPLLTVTTTSDSQTAVAGGSTTGFVDAAGAALYSLAADGSIVATSRDVLGRAFQTQRIAASGSSSKISSSTVYDAKGRVIATHDDSAGTKTYTYSATGQLIEIGETPTDQVPEGLNGVQYVYGSFGRMSQKIPFSWTNSSSTCGSVGWTRTPAAGTAGSNATSYYYDSYSYPTGATFTTGRLAAVANDVSTIAYSYNASGQVLQRAESFNALSSTAPWNTSPWNTVTYTYRNDGKLTSTSVASAALTSSVSYNTWYDSLGRVIEVEDGTSNVFWSALSGSPSTLNPGYLSGQTNAAYDSLGRLSGLNGSSAGFWFDNGAGTKSAAYDPSSNLLTGYSSTVTNGGTPASTIAVSGMTYQGSKLAGYQDTVSGNVYSFGYDSTDRLSLANSNSGSLSYTGASPHQTYNEGDSFTLPSGGSLGNIQSVTDLNSGGVTTNYNYSPSPDHPSLDQLSSTALSTAPTVNVTPAVYETFLTGTATIAGRGLVTSYTDAGGIVWSYAYDAEMRLSGISSSSGGGESIGYNPQGELAARSIVASPTTVQGQFRAASDLVISVPGTVSGSTTTWSSSPTAAVNVRVAGSRIATVSSSTVLYFHRDRQGSVIGTSTKGGTLGALYRYLPYGQRDVTLGETIGNASELGYTGALMLSGGLLYMNAREYLPQLRRFLQADNVDVKRYTYVNGDPINYSDPTGHVGYELQCGHAIHSFGFTLDSSLTSLYQMFAGGSGSDIPGGAVLAAEVAAQAIPVVGEILDIAGMVYLAIQIAQEAQAQGSQMSAATPPDGTAAQPPASSDSGSATPPAADSPSAGMPDAAGGTHTAPVDAEDVAGTPDPDQKPRFIGQANGDLVDTDSTPAGRYDQPNGTHTDILQITGDHGFGDSHTHWDVINVNPAGESFYNGKEEIFPVSPEDVGNIQSGTATPSSPKGR